MPRKRNFSRLYAIARAKGIDLGQHKQTLVEAFTAGRTASLRGMTAEEYDRMCNCLEAEVRLGKAPALGRRLPTPPKAPAGTKTTSKTKAAGGAKITPPKATAGMKAQGGSETTAGTEAPSGPEATTGSETQSETKAQPGMPQPEPQPRPKSNGKAVLTLFIRTDLLPS